MSKLLSLVWTLLLVLGLTGQVVVLASMGDFWAECEGWEGSVENLTGRPLARSWEVRLDNNVIAGGTVDLAAYEIRHVGEEWPAGALTDGQFHQATFRIIEDDRSWSLGFGPCDPICDDRDGDGTCDEDDGCPEDPHKIAPGACGCGVVDTDSDSDGAADCIDGCPADPLKIAPGVCGCGVADTDTDGDRSPDCIDECPLDPGKTVPGVCGCGTPDTDTDGDGTLDCNDSCPNDPAKVTPGVCGCGVADSDSDGDGALDCNDGCPADPAKVAPGVCGCGVADSDSDGDGTPDCIDGCPNDPGKVGPGACGCGVADTDSDSDGTADCIDDCPNDPIKIAPGVCGCGAPDTDADGDGYLVCQDCNDQDGMVYPGAVEVCDGRDNDCDGQVDEGGVCQPCLRLIKTLNGPYRTADDLFLEDRIIPVAVQTAYNDNLYGGENLFYFEVTLKVENCGNTTLTNISVADTFGNEAQPFAIDAAADVEIDPLATPGGLVHESLKWAVGDIPAGQSRTLTIKVGTEGNPFGQLEPTSGEQNVFYNGRDGETGSAVATADGGLSASVGAMLVSIGPEITCVNSDGDWDELFFGDQDRHDKCAQVTTSLPLEFDSGTRFTPTLEWMARNAAAIRKMTTSSLATPAWTLPRQRLITQ